MESGKSLIHLLKGGLCLLFLSGQICSATENEIVNKKTEAQQQFNIAIDLILNENSNAAVDILSDLYEKTKSIRVKLEWARAAFISHQYELSRKLFEEVQKEEIPESVRFNIGLYTSEIAKITPSTNYGFEITKDANPFSMASPQEIFIYGLPFKYEPQIKPESLYGLGFYVSHSIPVFKNPNLRFIGGFDITQYQGAQRNKYAGHAALDYRLNNFKNIAIRAGIDSFYQLKEHVLDQNYLNLQHRMDYASGPVNTVQIDIRFSKNIYPSAPSANGISKYLSITASKNISSGLQIGGSIFSDENSAKLDSLSFKTNSTSLFLKKYVPQVGGILKFNLQRAYRDYNGVDELFLLTRNDKRKITSVNFTKNSKVFDLYPSVEFGIEKFKSNIPINSYERSFINLQLRKVFN